MQLAIKEGSDCRFEIISISVKFWSKLCAGRMAYDAVRQSNEARSDE
jgi:hypothetical protein